MNSDKILVFCDDIISLKEYSLLMNKPAIHGSTSEVFFLIAFDDWNREIEEMSWASSKQPLEELHYLLVEYRDFIGSLRTRLVIHLLIFQKPQWLLRFLLISVVDDKKLKYLDGCSLWFSLAFGSCTASKDRCQLWVQCLFLYSCVYGNKGRILECSFEWDRRSFMQRSVRNIWRLRAITTRLSSKRSLLMRKYPMKHGLNYMNRYIE